MAEIIDTKDCFGKKRWLALHNFRSTPEFFKDMLAEVLEVAGDIHVDFVQAPHKQRGPSMYPIEGFEWWSSPTYKSFMMGWIGDVGLDESLAFLESYVAEHGPYDGVIGFSQGGGMAYNLFATGRVPRAVLFSPVVPNGREWPEVECGDDVVLFKDPADFTGEAFPLGKIHHIIEHGENHSIPKLTDEMRSALRRIFCFGPVSKF